MPAASSPHSLLPRTTCPHCWAGFAPEESLWISAHADLLGDPRLGPDEPQRFLPTRFDVDGNALDARGLVCRHLACPKCHLGVPRGLLEMEPTFLSILGTPACGKSFFLTALTWELRRLLPAHFALSFTDADPASNRGLNEYEEALFLNGRGDELVPLADLIRKTELQGTALYDTVQYGTQSVSYPRPFLFGVQPQERHPSYAARHRLARVLCLYDNAGEHFQPGQDSVASPVTQHLAQSRLLFYLFDPTQDPRFRRVCEEKRPGCLSPTGSRTSRQESVLQEAAARVRRYAGLAQSARHTRPLIVVVTKLDAWSHLLPGEDWTDPWVQGERISALNLDVIERRSQVVRTLLGQVCPEVVGAAEGFAQQVVYVPVSALGCSPVLRDSVPVVRSRAIKPLWAAVPFLYGVCRWLPGLIPNLKRKTAPATTELESKSRARWGQVLNLPDVDAG